MSKKGVLLVNLGSPDSPAVPDVKKYLREFLMDPRVLDAPWPIRFGVVNFSILPTRPRASAEAYQSIWWKEGAPLVVISRRVRGLLEEQTGLPVELAMRYQNPSIASAIANIAKKNITDLVVVPLFPHYAMSSYESAVEEVRRVAGKHAPRIRLRVVPPFYAEPGYIEALAAVAEPYLKRDYDHLLFSFHGLPERHLRKSDPTGCHCLRVENCCEVESPAHATCYRSQTFKTAEAFVKRAEVPSGKHSIAFQSRLGREPWMTPYTDKEIERLAKGGVRKLLVMCPAFVSDCLETLEEIGMRGREIFLEAGGAEFEMIPCLNEHPLWIKAMEEMIGRM